MDGLVDRRRMGGAVDHYRILVACQWHCQVCG
jgi:hypothetical protein